MSTPHHHALFTQARGLLDEARRYFTSGALIPGRDYLTAGLDLLMLLAGRTSGREGEADPDPQWRKFFVEQAVPYLDSPYFSAQCSEATRQEEARRKLGEEERRLAAARNAELERLRVEQEKRDEIARQQQREADAAARRAAEATAAADEARRREEARQAAEQYEAQQRAQREWEEQYAQQVNAAAAAAAASAADAAQRTHASLHAAAVRGARAEVSAEQAAAREAEARARAAEAQANLAALARAGAESARAKAQGELGEAQRKLAEATSQRAAMAQRLQDANAEAEELRVSLGMRLSAAEAGVAAELASLRQKKLELEQALAASQAQVASLRGAAAAAAATGGSGSSRSEPQQPHQQPQPQPQHQQRAAPSAAAMAQMREDAKLAISKARADKAAAAAAASAAAAAAPAATPLRAAHGGAKARGRSPAAAAVVSRPTYAESLQGQKGITPDDIKYVEQLERTVVSSGLNVAWGDIAGLEEAKRKLQECMQPMTLPRLFKPLGELEPWTGALLYGPPGTGKTMLARAMATQCGATFINVEPQTLQSQWVGAAPKLVGHLFGMARFYAPSIVFLDEIDGIARDSTKLQTDMSRSMLETLKVAMDGISSSAATVSAGGGAGVGAGVAKPPLVFVLGATNKPGDLDIAVLRRLQRRVYIPLPALPERAALLALCLFPFPCAADVDLVAIAERTQGFSAVDVKEVLKVATSAPLRRKTEEVNARFPGQSAEQLRLRMETMVQAQAAIKSTPITQADLLAAVAAYRPTVPQAVVDQLEAFGK